MPWRVGDGVADAEAASTKARAAAEQVAFAASEAAAETARRRLSEAEAERAALLADAEADRALTTQLREEARRLVQDREAMEQELRQKDGELQQAAREQLERSQTAWVTNKHSVELLKTESVTDATGTHTVYHYIFDDPEHAGGPKPVLQKRYSEFAALQAELLAAPGLKVAEIAAPFPRTTFTSWGARYQSTIDERKHALAQWLNVVLYLHGPADVPALAAFCQASAPADDAAAATPSLPSGGTCPPFRTDADPSTRAGIGAETS